MLKPPALCKKCGFDSQFEKIDAHRWPRLSRDQQNGRSAENGSRPPFPLDEAYIDSFSPIPSPVH